MILIAQWNDVEKSVVKEYFTLEVADGLFADVCHVPDTGLIYVMNNENGFDIYTNEGEEVRCMTADEDKEICDYIHKFLQSP